MTYLYDKDNQKRSVFINGRNGEIINEAELSLNEAKYQMLVFWPARFFLFLVLLVIFTSFLDNDTIPLLLVSLFLLTVGWLFIASRLYSTI